MSHYLLSLVSAAVTGGASRLEICRSKGMLTVTWDGCGLTPDALRTLADSLDGARREGVITLTSPLARLEPDGSVVSQVGRPENRFELREPAGLQKLGGWVRRKLSGEDDPFGVLRSRCDLAPLELRVQGEQVRHSPQVEPLSVLVVGDPPELGLTGPRRPASEWGQGYLVLTAGVLGAHQGRLVCRGVSEEAWDPAVCPGAHVWWWTDRLPLEQAWNEWLAACFQELVEQLPPGSMAPEQLRWVVRRGSRARLILRGEGSRATVEELELQFRRAGYLPVAERPGENPWGPRRIVVPEPHSVAWLEQRFPNLVAVDHLAGRAEMPRLPEGDSYLVRMPLPEAPGEIGLRKELPPLACRQWAGSGWKELMALPVGVDLRGDKVYASLEEVRIPLAELTLAALNRTVEPGEEDLVHKHLIFFFFWLTTAMKSSLDKSAAAGPLQALLQPGTGVVVQLVRKGHIGVPEFRRFLQEIVFLIRGEHKVSLLELVERGGRVYTMTEKPADARGEILVMDSWIVGILNRLVEPGCHFEQVQIGPSTTILGRIRDGMEGTGTCDFLASIARVPGSAAARILGQLDAEGKAIATVHADPDEQCFMDVVRAASTFFNEERVLSSEVMLYNLTQVPRCGAARALAEAGITPEALWEALPQVAEQEVLEDLERRGEMWRELGLEGQLARMRALSLARAGRLEEARREAEQATVLAPASFGAWSTRALVASQVGAFAEALEQDRKALALAPENDLLWSNHAEHLMHAGQREEALEASRKALELRPDSPYSLGLMGLLESDPERGLEYCDRALRDPKCPLSVHEARARHLLVLGRKAEAADSLRSFLLARADMVLEYGLEERQAKARRILDELC